MERWRDAYDPVGWKVYTMGHLRQPGVHTVNYDTATGWMLDDEQYGLPFLHNVRRLGGLNVCTHKGISSMVDTGSPRDIGPAARMFPDLKFIVYHSGFEGDADAEGPYTEETAHDSINRLITSARDNGIGPGGNVYAELGSTWFMLMRRPVQAAHALGKLLMAFGEDNVLWGTDSCFYGPSLPLEDALRSFQIPADLCERFGYPQLTPAIKAKILGLNAARLFDIDPIAAMERFRNDDLTWARAAVEEYQANGLR
jgi:predicted TIM-barrel fold metal-dependent hydrolase